MSSYKDSRKMQLIFILVVTFIVLLSLSGLVLIQHLKSRGEAKAELFQSIHDNDYETACEIIKKYPSLVNENRFANDLFAKLCDAVSQPPLLQACAYGKSREDFIELFVENGADVNKCGNTVYNYPLLSLLERKEVDLARYLIDNGADLLVTREFSENVPLMVANICADNGDTVLQQKCFDIFKASIEQGAFVVPQGQDHYYRSCVGFTSVYGVAASGNQVLMVEYFLDNGMHGVDEIVHRDNKTALIVAAENGAYDVVLLLVNAGADKTVIDANGMTAYDYAVDTGNQALIELLKE